MACGQLFTKKRQGRTPVVESECNWSRVFTWRLRGVSVSEYLFAGTLVCHAWYQWPLVNVRWFLLKVVCSLWGTVRVHLTPTPGGLFAVLAPPPRPSRCHCFWRALPFTHNIECCGGQRVQDYSVGTGVRRTVRTSGCTFWTPRRLARRKERIFAGPGHPPQVSTVPCFLSGP